ncbi:DgyrCDS13682 [Dimorphilus gyrociliatus]|uniref:DgyrCDS13682 n=1 Tax=Dimorphilus gyrociliatus TaxID=2664684 RepID=A0A7I8WBF8_9ANNE|nr:DgyrCDS13682 [Dimorphilus gyrociliatus]
MDREQNEESPCSLSDFLSSDTPLLDFSNEQMSPDSICLSAPSSPDSENDESDKMKMSQDYKEDKQDRDISPKDPRKDSHKYKRNKDEEINISTSSQYPRNRYAYYAHRRKNTRYTRFYGAPMLRHSCQGISKN